MEPAAQRFARVAWEGDVPPQKWMNFYTKLLARFATQTGLNVALQVIVEPPGRVSQQQLDEMRAALTLRRLVSLVVGRFSDGR